MHIEMPSDLDPFLATSRSPATVRTYEAAWRDFRHWCAGRAAGDLPAPPERVAHYLADRATRLSPASLEKHLAAIAWAHRQAGHPFDRHHPLLADVRAGIRRTLGTAPAQKEPLAAADLRAVIATLPDTLAGRRDRAILLMGFAAALRRSEVVALDRRDLAFTSEGLALVIRRAKEDQEGRSLVKGVPFGFAPATCPVQAVKKWLIAARLDDGPLFRPVDRHGNLGPGRLSGAAVATIVKRAVARAARREGLTEGQVTARVAAVSGHSLRAGFVTSAAAAGATEWQIMRHTGHKKAETVRRYIRLGSLFTDNLAGKVGL